MKNQFKKTALVTALLFELSTGAQAATIMVDNTTCTLADAITSANDDVATNGCTAGAGADVLELPQGSEIILTTALPTIESDITLNANGSTIRRDQNSPAFPVLSLFGANGNLVLNDATITGGESVYSNDNWGGGIDTDGGYLTINSSEITGNIGSGINSIRTDTTIIDSVISNNRGVADAEYGAAGVTSYGAPLRVINSTFSNNITYGNARGGGLSVFGGSHSDNFTYILNSTFSGNSSEAGGGAIHLEQSDYNYPVGLLLANSTVTGNDTLQDGGAILNMGGVIISADSLISGNLAGNLVDEILNAGTFYSFGHNLLGLNGSSGSVLVNLEPTDAVIMESQITDVLNPVLADNGGFTPTHAIPFTSPAVDFIPAADCTPPEDQTGKARPSGNGCDVGAFEFDDTIFKDGFD